jgi:hypothetical protein
MTTLLGVLKGNNAGCRKLPRLIYRGFAMPQFPDVPGRAARAMVADFHAAWVSHPAHEDLSGKLWD